MSSVDNDQPSPSLGVEPIRSEDRRALELEELRKKQLAKNRSLEDKSGGGKSQPVPLESWYEQQRDRAKIIRMQQKDATENLRNYNAKTGIQTVGSDLKDELKKKELEAAEMLRNYRGRPQDYQQMLKQSKVDSTNRNIKADVVAPNAGEKHDIVPGKLAIQAGNNSLSDRGRSESQGTADWSVISGHDSDSDRGLSSTPVNVDMSILTEIAANGADSASGDIHTHGEDTPLSSSYVDAASEVEKKWSVAHITVSFGLLIHETDAPAEGIYSSQTKNDTVNTLILKLRLIAEKSLESQVSAIVAKQHEYPITITVQKDAKYMTPSNRPGVERNVIKATIPINVVEGDLQAVTHAKALVYNTLKSSLSELVSKS